MTQFFTRKIIKIEILKILQISASTMNNKEIWWGNIAFYLQLCENIKSYTWFFDEYWWDIELVLYSSLCQISRDVTSFVWHKKAHLYKRREDGQHYHFHIGGPGDGRQLAMVTVGNIFVWLDCFTNTHLPSVSPVNNVTLSAESAGWGTEKTLPRNRTELSHLIENTWDSSEQPTLYVKLACLSFCL